MKNIPIRNLLGAFLVILALAARIIPGPRTIDDAYITFRYARNILNAQGFAMPGEIGDLTTQGHFGLMGLLERVNLIGGSLNFHSSPGHGTHIRVDWRPSLNL